VTLRLRLILVLVGIVAVGLLVADVVTYTSLRSYLYSQVDQQLQTASSPVARALVLCQSEQSPFGDQGTCRLPTNQYNQIPTGTFAELRNSNGSLLYSLCFSGSTPRTPTLPSPLPVAQDAQSASSFSLTDTGCGSSTYNAIAVSASVGNSIGPYVVVVAVPLTSVDQTLGRLELIELLVTMAVLVALGAIAWWIVRKGLRPLDQMAATADAIAAGDLSRRVADTDLQTEVGKLGAALNKMLSEIEQAFSARAASEERLRRVLADASHELRTPLTSIRGYAELFDRGARYRPDDLATSMRHISEDANRMSVLVDDLLLLARLDHQRPLAQERVDLAETSEMAVEAARVSAPDRRITFEAPGDAVLVGDGDRLRQVLDNLLGNALRHTPPGTPVDVRVSCDPSTVAVEVMDHGPGVPDEERGRIFEPFHRADPSRARSSGGVGLGLAIVSAIVHAHGGIVGVDSTLGGGARFWFRIPRSRNGTAAGASDSRQVLEPRVMVDEGELDHTGGPVAMLGDDDLGHAALR
jgi:two-component system OmpR family sensor kinase